MSKPERSDDSSCGSGSASTLTHGFFDRAIARRPGDNAGDGLTAANLGSPDIPLMLSQHQAYIDALEAFGVTVRVLPADPEFPDGCFVEDVALLIPGLAVLTRPGAASRRGESAVIEPLLAADHEIARIGAPGTVDGGDVVMTDSCALIGLSRRTNTEGARQLAQILATRGIASTIVPVTDGLHLKSYVNFLSDQTLLVTAAYAGAPELSAFRQLTVSAGEEYAANCVVCGQQAIVATGFPATAALLEDLGFSVTALEMSEFRKMDGGLSCLSLRFGN